MLYDKWLPGEREISVFSVRIFGTEEAHDTSTVDDQHTTHTRTSLVRVNYGSLPWVCIAVSSRIATPTTQSKSSSLISPLEHGCQDHDTTSAVLQAYDWPKQGLTKQGLKPKGQISP